MRCLALLLLSALTAWSASPGNRLKFEEIGARAFYAGQIVEREQFTFDHIKDLAQAYLAGPAGDLRFGALFFAPNEDALSRLLVHGAPTSNTVAGTLAEAARQTTESVLVARLLVVGDSAVLSYRSGRTYREISLRGKGGLNLSIGNAHFRILHLQISRPVSFSVPLDFNLTVYLQAEGQFEVGSVNQVTGLIIEISGARDVFVYAQNMSVVWESYTFPAVLWFQEPVERGDPKRLAEQRRAKCWASNNRPLQCAAD